MSYDGSTTGSHLLRVKDLEVCFDLPQGKVQAVGGISYHVEAGETVCIVGESGCGKSAGALALLGLIPAPPGRVVQGEVLFEGQDLLQINKEELRKVRGNRIAMIFQDPMTALNPVLPVGYQVMEPLRIHKKVGKKVGIAECIRLLSAVQLADPASRARSFPHQLSGGMCQRVMIAMSMACRPKILIADEPTTALDVTVQAQLLQLMKQMTTTLKTALLLITHNLGIVARYADRVMVMYAGRIVESAKASDLFAAARHPYTRGLLQSVPRLDRRCGERLAGIAGRPPDLMNLPEGCAFYPRCDVRTDRCAIQRPPLEKVAESHERACWFDG